MLSAFQSILPAQLNVSQIMLPSENFSKDALHHVVLVTCTVVLLGLRTEM